MNHPTYAGQIVVAELQDLTGGKYNKFKGSIRSGELTGADCYVAYKGSPEPLVGKQVLIRLDTPRPGRDTDQYSGSSHFVASTLPDGFDTAQSDEVILYGMWKQGMPKKLNAPNLEELLEFFNIGHIFSTLHYSMEEGIVHPYRTFRFNDPELMRHDESGIIRSPGSALRRYLMLIRGPIGPRFVTMDGDEGIDRIIMPQFRRVIDSNQFSESMLLEMEPQQ
tara:strand:- start:19815 stop:20480 length:666 start_codon:yes stop_codon:yes gene_type:complete